MLQLEGILMCQTYRNVILKILEIRKIEYFLW